MDRRILKRSIRYCRSRDIENDYYLRNLGDPRCEIAGIYVASKKRFEWERFARANLTDKTIQSTLERDAQCPVVNSEIKNRKLNFAELTSTHSEYYLSLFFEDRGILLCEGIYAFRYEIHSLRTRPLASSESQNSVIYHSPFLELRTTRWHPRYPG